ncbi:MAG: methyltransferase domain-containing protein, partial [Burkholderiales bacterium]
MQPLFRFYQPGNVYYRAHHPVGRAKFIFEDTAAILCDAGLAERRRAAVPPRVQCPRPPRRSPGAGTPNYPRAAAEDEDAGFARICAEDLRHLAAIRDAREKSAADYFTRHAGEWDRLRALLAPADAVERALVAALGDEPLGEVLDIGTGTGRIAELLEPAAAKVTGLDKSPEMLRLARARLQGLPAGRVELVQGDFSALPFAP